MSWSGIMTSVQDAEAVSMIWSAIMTSVQEAEAVSMIWSAIMTAVEWNKKEDLVQVILASLAFLEILEIIVKHFL